MMLLTLSVPAEDWFTPCENAVTTRSVRGEQLDRTAACGRASIPQTRADSLDVGPPSSRRDAAQRFERRWCASSTNSRVEQLLLVQVRQQAVEQRTRRCRSAIGRCRSAISQVGVRRGSITTSFSSGRCSFARSDALEQDRDGTTPCSTRPARSDRRARDPRSTRARCPRQTRACGRPLPRPCTAASWYRCSRCR